MLKRTKRPYTPWQAVTHKMAPPSKDRTAYFPVTTEYAGTSDLRADSPDLHNHLHLSTAVELYRNNLVACSTRYNLLFIAVRSKVHVYQPSYPTQALGKLLITLHGPEELPNLRGRGYINRQVPHTINNMIVADLGKEEVLLIANDSGYVTLWYTKHLMQRQGHMDMWFDVEQSAWGLAVHQTKRLIAISANTTYVSVFEMGNEAIDSSLPPRGATSPIVLHAHHQNIPTISFLQDPSGRWLAATDITGNVILYDLLKNRKASTMYNGQGWTVTLVPKEDFLCVEKTELEGLIDKARADSETSASQGLLSFRVNDFEESEAESDPDDWASDVQMTISGGDESDDDDEGSNAYLEFGWVPDEEDDSDSEAGSVVDEDQDEIETEETEGPAAETMEASSEEAEEPVQENISSVPMTEEAQTAAYGPVPVSESPSEISDNASPIPVDVQPPWEYPPPSFIIHAKEFDLKLLSTQEQGTHAYNRHEHIVNLVTLRNLIPADSITIAAQTSRFPLRLNMHTYIPALSLFVVGRQDGRVALVRLIISKPAKIQPDQSTIDVPGEEGVTPNKKREHNHLLHLEHILPSGDIRIPFALAGVCSAPLQGWEDRDVKRGMGEGKGQGKWLHLGGDVGGRWRIFLLYTDGKVISYTISGGVSAGGDQVVF